MCRCPLLPGLPAMQFPHAATVASDTVPDDLRRRDVYYSTQSAIIIILQLARFLQPCRPEGVPVLVVISASGSDIEWDGLQGVPKVASTYEALKQASSSYLIVFL